MPTQHVPGPAKWARLTETERAILLGWTLGPNHEPMRPTPKWDELSDDEVRRVADNVDKLEPLPDFGELAADAVAGRSTTDDGSTYTEAELGEANREEIWRQFRETQRVLASGVVLETDDAALALALCRDYRRYALLLDLENNPEHSRSHRDPSEGRWAQDHALSHEMLDVLIELRDQIGGRPAGRGESHSSATVKDSTRGIDVDAKAYEGSPTDGLAQRAVDLYFDTRDAYERRKAERAAQA